MFDWLFKKNTVEKVNKSPLTNSFLDNKKNALMHISDSFKRYNSLYLNDVNRFDMIKWKSTSPSFEDFVFSYGNKVFAVIVESANIKNGQLAMQLDERADILISICKNNNLIPCVFPIIKQNGKLVFLGINHYNIAWNLVNLLTGQFVDPVDESTDELIEMSDWEIQDWAIQITLQELEKKGLCVTSFVSMPDIEPQIWFEDHNGKHCWVKVIGTRCSERDNFSVNDYSTEVLKYDGYLSHIDFAEDEAHTDGRIYRGRPADFEVKEFTKIHNGL